MAESAPLLEIDRFSLAFATDEGSVDVVEQVSLAIPAGRTVGLVGESGCGKSVTAMSVLRLLPSPPARVTGGAIRFQGQDLLRLPARELRRIRGNRVGMIFQEPMTSLNPTLTVGRQVTEVLRLHQGMDRAAARRRCLEILDQVGIGAPEARLAQYPHELSGGLRQRVMIAMALACGPDLLIADEPTTALDVTVQAQILDLLVRLQAELGMSILLISHDLGVVAEVCETVAVMYAGRIVERAPTAALFAAPRHPYTHGLLASTPRLGDKRAELPTIPGMVPRPGQRGLGCHFAERCPAVTERCRREAPMLAPVLDPVAPDHEAACWNPIS